MTVALANVGRHGRMELTFGVRDGRTIIRDSYCEVPFKIMRPFRSALPEAAHLTLMHCTAGVFGGDELECAIHIESGARVRVTQQAATRVHPSENRLAHQSLRILVEAGASLYVDLEPVIPFARSRYLQETKIDVKRGGTLAYWECMMAGRIGSREEWEFEEFGSETRLNLDGHTIFLDRYLLRPAVMNMHSRWVMGNATYVGTGLYCGADIEQITEALHEAMPSAGVDIVDRALSVTRLTENHGPDFHRLRRVWNEVAHRLSDGTSSRGSDSKHRARS